MPSYTDSRFSCDRYPLPTVNMGGTSRDLLLKGYLAARDAVADALAASEAIEFHPRDYPSDYPPLTGSSAWDKASVERTCHEKNLKNFLGHLDDHIESLYETAN